MSSKIAVQDARRLDWIVETASVADAPLYLQITRQLYRKGLLEHLDHEQGPQAARHQEGRPLGPALAPA